MPSYLSFLSKDSHYQEKALALGVMKEASVLIATSVSPIAFSAKQMILISSGQRGRQPRWC